MRLTSYQTAPLRNGCGNRIRTYDLLVMSQVSYQTAPFRHIKGGLFFRSEPPRPHMKGNENRLSGWYQRWELNPRPPPYEGGALNQLSYSGISRKLYAEFSLKGFLVYPSEPKIHQYASMLATPRGLEPLTSGVTGRRSNQLNYEAIWRQFQFMPRNPISRLECPPKWI